MSIINTPATVDAAPEASRPLLQAVKAQLGSAPNLFRLTGNSPAALEGYLALNGALGKGALPGAIRERIALAVAELNGCNYCLAAHTYLGKNVAKLSDAEIDAAREGRASEPKADAAVRFAAAIVRERGHVGEAAVTKVRSAGFSDEEIVEIIAHVALNTLTNYINTVGGTAIDFPAVRPSANGSEAA